MSVIETRVKKWGNSFGIIIPSSAVEKEKLIENQEIQIIILKDSRKVLRESFGMAKGKLNKSGQQFKDDVRAELYNN